MSILSAADIQLFASEFERLLGDTCTIKRKGARTGNARFGFTTALDTIATDVKCAVDHGGGAGGGAPTKQVLYADRLSGRAFALIYVPRTQVVYDYDQIEVSGGDTYEVVGPPHLDTNAPGLVVPCGAHTPVVVNP